jgi:hypothetical protein
VFTVEHVLIGILWLPHSGAVVIVLLELSDTTVAFKVAAGVINEEYDVDAFVDATLDVSVFEPSSKASVEFENLFATAGRFWGIFAKPGCSEDL